MTIIPPATGTSFILKQGQFLSVCDIDGTQVSDLFCVSQHDPSERLSSLRTIDYNDGILVSAEGLLYSNRSQPMLKIIKDTCGRHDLLMPPCSLKMFQIVAGDDTLYHPSCHENLSKNLSSFGISEDDIHNTFNIFMNVQVDPAGGVKINAPTSRKGDTITFQAQIDLIVALTACSHEETNGGSLKPIGYRVYSQLEDN